MSRFKYRERSAETVAARAKQTGGDYDSILSSNVPVVKIREGENVFRIMPPTWSVKEWGDNWGIEVWAHGQIGVDNQSYLCVAKMKGEDCCICDAIRDMDPEDAKSIKARKRILAYVINRDQEKEGPMIWNLSWSLEKDIQVRSTDKKTGAVIPIDHPEAGYDVSFTREGQKLNTRYVGVDIARDDTPLSDREARQDKWLDFIEDNPIPTLLVFHDQDYIAKVFTGGSSKEDKDEEKPTRSGRRSRDEDDEEEKPSRRRASAKEDAEEEKPKRRARDEDEEEEKPRRSSRKDYDDELPDDEQMERNARRTSSRKDEPEEEEKPRRRSRDEDEEEEKPRRRASAKDEEEEERPRRRREEPEDEPSDRARRSLEKLKPGSQRRK